MFCIYENASVGMSIASYDPTDYDGEGSLGITKLFEYMILDYRLSVQTIPYGKK